MPGKKKASLKNKGLLKKLILPAAVAVVAYGFYTLGEMQGLDTQAALSRISVGDQYHQDKMQMLFNTVKANASGAKQDPADLTDFYARNLTPAMAAKLKNDGPSALFCSSKIPDLMTFRPLGGNDNFSVDEVFFNGPGQASTTQNVIIEFSGPKDDSDHMAVFKEVVSKVNCQ